MEQDDEAPPPAEPPAAPPAEPEEEDITSYRQQNKQKTHTARQAPSILPYMFTELLSSTRSVGFNFGSTCPSQDGIHHFETPLLFVALPS